MFKIVTSKRSPILFKCLQARYSTSDNENKSTKDTSKESSLSTSTHLTTKPVRQELPQKEDLKWRTPWHQKEGSYYSSGLRAFYDDNNKASLLKLLQTPLNLTPTSIKKFFKRLEEDKNLVTQYYLPERTQVLGSELAAAHFTLYRGGSVKFFGDDNWHKADAWGEYDLPNNRRDDMFLQAIDCSGMRLHYEGLQNYRGLQQLEWFRLKDCKNMDDWCLDIVGNLFKHSLLYLDIRDCPSITFRGLGALCKMEKLKILVVDDIYKSDEYEMSCLMLQEVNPHLDIQTE